MLTYFSQVLPKNLLWLWKYIREYYRKWIHFLPFTYVGLVHGPEPLPWAMSFYNLSGEVHEHQMMHSVYFPPAVECREEDFLIWNTFLLFGHFGPIQGPEPQETWILQFWRRGSWTSYNKMYRCILWLSLTQLWSWEEDFYI